MKSVKRPVSVLNEPIRKRVNDGRMVRECCSDNVKQQLFAVVVVINFFAVVIDMLNTEHVAAYFTAKIKSNGHDCHTTFSCFKQRKMFCCEQKQLHSPWTIGVCHFQFSELLTSIPQRTQKGKSERKTWKKSKIGSRLNDPVKTIHFNPNSQFSMTSSSSSSELIEFNVNQPSNLFQFYDRIENAWKFGSVRENEPKYLLFVCDGNNIFKYQTMKPFHAQSVRACVCVFARESEYQYTTTSSKRTTRSRLS